MQRTHVALTYEQQHQSQFLTNKLGEFCCKYLGKCGADEQKLARVVREWFKTWKLEFQDTVKAISY